MNDEIRRQMIHALGAFSIIVLILFTKEISILIFSVWLAILILGSEFRKDRERFRNHSLFKLKPVDYLENLLHKFIVKRQRKEEYPLKGPIMFYLGCLITVILFPPFVAAVSILILAICDSISTVVGKMYGNHKLFINKDKSWEGSTAFFIFCLIILYMFVDPIKALAISILVTFVEMLPKIDDNVSVPLVAGALLYLFI